MAIKAKLGLEFILAVIVPFVLYGAISFLFLVLVLPFILFNRFSGVQAISQSAMQSEFLIGTSIASIVILVALTSLGLALERGVAYFRTRTRLKYGVIIGISLGCILSGVMLVLAAPSLWPFSIVYIVSPGFSLVIGVKTIFDLIMERSGDADG